MSSLEQKIDINTEQLNEVISLLKGLVKSKGPIQQPMTKAQIKTKLDNHKKKYTYLLELLEETLELRDGNKTDRDYMKQAAQANSFKNKLDSWQMVYDMS